MTAGLNRRGHSLSAVALAKAGARRGQRRINRRCTQMHADNNNGRHGSARCASAETHAQAPGSRPKLIAHGRFRVLSMAEPCSPLYRGIEVSRMAMRMQRRAQGARRSWAVAAGRRSRSRSGRATPSSVILLASVCICVHLWQKPRAVLRVLCALCGEAGFVEAS